MDFSHRGEALCLSVGAVSCQRWSCHHWWCDGQSLVPANRAIWDTSHSHLLPSPVLGGMGTRVLRAQQRGLLPALLCLSSAKERDEPAFSLKVSGVL